jgi:hypothetical protein
MKIKCTLRFLNGTAYSKNDSFLNFKSNLLFFLFAICFPFVSQGQIQGSINIDTNVRTNANKLLLGTNQGDFMTADNKDVIRYINPITVRFPVGAISNWYNYTTDGVTDYGDTYLQNLIDDGSAQAVVYKNFINSNLKSGYTGMAELQKSMNFDVLWTYNLLYDSPDRSLKRMKNDRSTNELPVNFIELGNEFFWKDQRSTQLDSPEKYVTRAKLVSQKLKIENPSVKLSVPLSFSNTSYNDVLTADDTYFDAVSYHRYVELEVKNEDPKTYVIYKRMLTARKEYMAGVTEIRKATGKKLWLTEWSVGCGLQAASFIGMADVYLYLFANQDTYERANYFIANAKANPLYTFNNNIKTLSNLRVTGYGAVFKTVRSVFESSVMLGTDVTYSSQLDGVDVVTARAVNKTVNGVAQTLIFIVNKGGTSIDLEVRFNGGKYYGTYTHKAMAFDDYGDTISFGPTQEVLSSRSTQTGFVRIPARSVNVISGIIGKGNPTAKIDKSVKEADAPEVNELAVYPNPSKNGLFDINKSGNWEVYNLVGSKVKTGNGTSVDLSNMAKGTYILKTSEVSKTIIYQ